MCVNTEHYNVLKITVVNTVVTVKYFKFQRSYNQKHSVDRKLVTAVIHRNLVNMEFQYPKRKR